MVWVDSQGAPEAHTSLPSTFKGHQGSPGASSELARAPGGTQDPLRTREVNLTLTKKRRMNKSTPVGFEPTRGDPIGLAGRRLSHSAKVSLAITVLRDLTTAPSHQQPNEETRTTSARTNRKQQARGERANKVCLCPAPLCVMFFLPSRVFLCIARGSRARACGHS